jgi:hypothetical protein
MMVFSDAAICLASSRVFSRILLFLETHRYPRSERFGVYLLDELEQSTKG